MITVRFNKEGDLILMCENELEYAAVTGWAKAFKATREACIHTELYGQLPKDSQ